MNRGNTTRSCILSQMYRKCPSRLRGRTETTPRCETAIESSCMLQTSRMEPYPTKGLFYLFFYINLNKKLNYESLITMVAFVVPLP